MSEVLTEAEKLVMCFEEPKNFEAPLRTIEALQKALSCNSCKKLMVNPTTLWSCEHVYCRVCANVFEHCPVCSLPAWNEDQRENKAVTVILDTTKALHELLQGYMDLTSGTKTTDCAVTFPESSPQKAVSEAKDAGNILAEKIKPQSLPEQKKPKKTNQRRSKVKFTPSRPFPAISDDSEDTQIPNELPDSSTACVDTPSKPGETEKLPAERPTDLAAPTPPKRKRAYNRAPFTPKNSTRKVSTPLKSRRLAKTPKTPRNAPRTPIRKTPKTPKSAKKNKKGETPLHIAAIKGNLEEVQKLIQTGVDINAADNAGWTPLHEACNHGHLEVIEKLLDAGVLVNIPGYEDETPLMDAARHGHAAIVKLLLDRGADVTLRTVNGVTAPDLASNDEIRQVFEDHIFLTQSALADFSPENADSAPENIIMTFHFTLNMSKINLVSEILNATLSPKDALTATHLITPSYEGGRSPRQTKYLQAVARGIWIVKTDWLEACKANGSWVNEQEFEISGSRNDLIDGGPKRSRLNKSAKRPPIFHGCHFFLTGHFKPPTFTKRFVVELIQLAGGVLLIREPRPDSDSVQTCTKVPYHAHKDTAQYFHTYYIVYDGENGAKPSRMVRRGKVCTVPLSWVLDCISQFYLCDIPESFA